MHKREFVMVFVAFFSCFGLSFFIGLAGKYPLNSPKIKLYYKRFKGPPITYTTEIDGKALLLKENQSHHNSADIATGPFIMRTPALTTYAQQLWVIAKLTTGNTDGLYYF